jgi:hypothetical protein
MRPWQETTALRDFDPAYVCFGSSASLWTRSRRARHVRFAPFATELLPPPAIRRLVPGGEKALIEIVEEFEKRGSKCWVVTSTRATRTLTARKPCP